VTANVRLLRADFQASRGPLDTMPKRCVGAGRVAEGLRGDWQRQLRYVKEHCGFGYLRMHGLLGDDMGVYREEASGRAEFNWQYSDEVYAPRKRRTLDRFGARRVTSHAARKNHLGSP